MDAEFENFWQKNENYGGGVVLQFLGNTNEWNMFGYDYDYDTKGFKKVNYGVS